MDKWRVLLLGSKSATAMAGVVVIAAAQRPGLAVVVHIIDYVCPISAAVLVAAIWAAGLEQAAAALLTKPATVKRAVRC